ncbi:MAG: elongation factor P [Candidatus Auribacterota bacterium]|jgi:elongation factor P|uniref:Elongation factor P n=1 Tax=Candidatus Auribacter fodinae TaxID=2093366 RepID=A0A3A4QW17_9BACT|nr:MAG: elongation factor P [Candidatus Auribacter fodinae]
MIKASELKRGMAFMLNNEIHIVTELEHRTPGNLRAFIQLSYKNLNTGKAYSNRHRPTDEFEAIELVSRPTQYLYKDGDLYYFMKLDDYETIHMEADDIGSDRKFLKENMELTIMFHGEKPIQIELPTSITYEVVSTIPGVKGDTVTNVQKPATLETGLEVNVPLFIKEGDVIKIDTRTGAYIGKAN